MSIEAKFRKDDKSSGSFRNEHVGVRNNEKLDYNRKDPRKGYGQFGNVIVNYTPDLYDKSKGDLATHSTKAAIGNGYMVGRNFKKGGRTFFDWTRKVRVNHFLRGDKVAKANRINNRVKPERHLNVRKSIKMTGYNQSRKAVSGVANSDDLSTATVGKTMKGAWASVKYRKRAIKIAKGLVGSIKGAIAAVVGFLASLPGIIAGVFTGIPAIIIAVVVCVVISIFSNYSYYGRVEAIVKYAAGLETKYGITVNIPDVLSITYALEWTKGSQEQYDTLIRYMYCSNPLDGKTAKTTDFETAMTRVFKTQNPGRCLNNDDDWGVGEGFNDFAYGQLKAKNIKDYFDVYPSYKALAVGTPRKDYGSDANIEELKKTARGSREYNEKAYVSYIGDQTGFNYGEINTGDKSARARFLFPNGTPSSESEARSYLKSIQVPILDKNGRPTVRNISVHEAIASTVLQCYIEMKNAGFRAYDTGTFSWRKIAGGGGSMSNHSFGLALDINATYNPQIGSGGYDTGSASQYDASGNNHLSISPAIANIWKKHGFYWGGDYKSKKDYMHFEYIHGALKPGTKY